MYYEIEKKIINNKNASDDIIKYDEIIILWKKCIDNKILNWRNNIKLVDHCFKLHQLYIKNNNDKIDHQYISLITCILSNSSFNRDKMNTFINKDLFDNNLINISTFELLIKSCYNEYSGKYFLIK